MENFVDSIIDWEKFDAASDLSERMKGVSEESLKLEVELWQKQIEILEPMNYDVIKKEIEEWDIGVNKHNLTFEYIAGNYSRLVAYKYRVSMLLALAKQWTETCKNAIDTIEDLACGVPLQGQKTTATMQKAYAKNISKTFIHLKNTTSKVENYLFQVNSSIEFCAKQLDLLIKEKQSQAKLNYRLVQEGEGYNAKSYQEPVQEEESIEENGETFVLIKSRRNR
jgi:hypothetical protein